MKRRLTEECHCYKERTKSYIHYIKRFPQARIQENLCVSPHREYEDVWVNRGKAPHLQARILTSASDINEL
jgi:uridine kinase